MKLIKTLTAASVVLLGLTSVNVTSAFAATAAEAPGKTTATFDVEDGDLTLVQTPDLVFKSISTKDLVNNKDNLILGLNATPKDIVVDDYKLAAQGWTLTANASQFTNDKYSTENASILLKVNGTENNISTGDQNVFSGDADALGSNKGKVTGTTLDLSGVKKSSLRAGTYSADITWTLTEGAPAKAAK